MTRHYMNPTTRQVFRDNDGRGGYVPVVVIDPENREQVTRLADLFETTLCSRPVVDRMRDSLRRSLIAPPKPPEPTGLGAVVEDAEGRFWVHTVRGNNPWTDTVQGTWRKYADLAAVRVLSEGVTP